MSAACAEAAIRKCSRASTAASGNGTMKIKNPTGKAKALSHFLPRNTKAPDTKKHKNEKTVSAKKSFQLKAAGPSFNATVSAAIPGIAAMMAQPHDVSPNAGDLARSRRIR